jgi:hypothetical protein
VHRHAEAGHAEADHHDERSFDHATHSSAVRFVATLFLTPARAIHTPVLLAVYDSVALPAPPAERQAILEIFASYHDPPVSLHAPRAPPAFLPDLI